MRLWRRGEDESLRRLKGWHLRLLLEKEKGPFKGEMKLKRNGGFLNRG